jgi:hypothetical protein
MIRSRTFENFIYTSSYNSMPLASTGTADRAAPVAAHGLRREHQGRDGTKKLDGDLQK